MKLIFLFIFSLILSSANPAIAQEITPPHPGPDEVSWKSLTYTAKSFFGTATAVVKLDTCQQPALPAQFNKPPIGTGSNAFYHPGNTFCLSVTNTIKPYFSANRFYQTKVWFSPKKGMAIRRLRLLRGKKYYLKDYLFTPAGVYRCRKKPADAKEETASPELWSDTEESFYSMPGRIAATTIVSEPSLILYYLSANDGKQDCQMTDICVFNKKQYHLVHLTRRKPIKIEVDYLEQRGNEQKSVKKEEIEAVGYQLTNRPVEENDKATPEKFSFMGLTGDITIYFNEKSHIPIRIEGNIPLFGRTQFNLQDVIRTDRK